MNKQVQSIIVDRLQFDTSIGVFDWEKQVRQTLVLNLEAEYVTSRASSTDRIEDAISYVDVCDALVQLAHSRHFDLLEHLAACMCDLLLEKFAFQSLEIVLLKPGAVPATDNVGVKMRRER